MPVFSFTALAVSFLCLFGLSEFFYAYFKMKAEHTRKIVHIVSGLLVFTFPIYLNHIGVLLLCLSFLIILLWSKKNKQLNGINNVGRTTKGSELYPIAVFIAFSVFQWTSDPIYFYLPIAILAFADPVAALVGQNTNSRKIKFGDKNKSVAGSLAFIITSIIICYITNIILKTDISILQILLISIIACIAEMLSKNGYDNITIPLSVMAVYMLSQLI